MAFSHCGRFLAASGTHNRAPVWDVRMLGGGGAGDASAVGEPATSSSRAARRLAAEASLLHVLSHGAPAEVVESVVGNQPGTASEGEQRINALAFFHGEPMLVTAGSNGVGLWNVLLGTPEVLWCAARRRRRAKPVTLCPLLSHRRPLLGAWMTTLLVAFLRFAGARTASPARPTSAASPPPPCTRRTAPSRRRATTRGWCCTPSAAGEEGRAPPPSC